MTTTANTIENDRNLAPSPFAPTYFHGTKAELRPGDLIAPTLDAAIWGAELAVGEGKERIYLVEPTGEIEDDPDLTDKKFPGNPTKSYRSKAPFRVVGEVTQWQGHPVDQVTTMKVHLDKLREQGIHSLNDE